MACGSFYDQSKIDSILNEVVVGYESSGWNYILALTRAESRWLNMLTITYKEYHCVPSTRMKMTTTVADI